ncbi:MAG TPA: glycosyltransferase family A protein [Nitrospira sp.]|nr:glycosyltransferase family A protein [Nitrospira sp.]
MPEPLVSVAMSVHDGASTVSAAIRSILWQTFPDWELILVNDASTDKTGSICRRFQDSRIRVIEETEQGGLAVRLNQAVSSARGKYIARMDADDIAYPERFTRQVDYLESHPIVDLVGHGAVLFKRKGEVVGLYPRAINHEDICRRPWWGFPLAHPTWMGKRSWFMNERYDERLTKGQDQELLLRTYRKSRFASLPECLLGYRIEHISVQKSARGRVAYCRRLLADMDDLGSLVHAVRGIGIHSIALARDFLFDLAGTVGEKSRRSYLSADQSVRVEWEAIWSRSVSEQADS